MKKLSLIALLSASSLLMYSCKEDEVNPVAGTDPDIESPEGEAPEEETPEEDVPGEFGEQSVEENKAQLEDNGIQLVNELQGLKDHKAVDAAANLARLIDLGSDDEVEPQPTYPGGRVLKSVSGLRTSAKSTTKVFSAMRLSEEPASVQEFYNESAGTYTWNAAIEDFDFVAGGDKIIYKFPAVEAGTQNNAIITIRDYAGVNIANPIDEEYAGDLPTNLVMDLTVDGSKVLEYGYKATYNNAGEPTGLDTYLNLAPYNFAVNLKNDTKKVELVSTLKNGDKVLIGMGASSDGNFAGTNIEGAVDTEDPSGVLSGASAYFQILNIKIAGTVDVENGYAAYDGLSDNLTENEEANKIAEIVNNHYELVVYYADSKEKIAETEAYVFTDIDEYQDEYGNMVEEKESVVGVRFIFADGSKSDFETYFEAGFDDLMDEVDSFMNTVD